MCAMLPATKSPADYSIMGVVVTACHWKSLPDYLLTRHQGKSSRPSAEHLEFVSERETLTSTATLRDFNGKHKTALCADFGRHSRINSIMQYVVVWDLTN
jgi:hypothetical protein